MDYFAEGPASSDGATRVLVLIDSATLTNRTYVLGRDV